MKLNLAKKIGDEANDILGRLDETSRWVKNNCSDEDFNWYKNLVAPVMASLVVDLLNPLYQRYPDAKPPNYD